MRKHVTVMVEGVYVSVVHSCMKCNYMMMQCQKQQLFHILLPYGPHFPLSMCKSVIAIMLLHSLATICYVNVLCISPPKCQVRFYVYVHSFIPCLFYYLLLLYSCKSL